MPERIQQSRRKGWRKPEGAIVVSRPSRWGNPYSVAEYGRDEAIRRYSDDLLHGRLPFGIGEARARLSGHDLVCWCALDVGCHADVLLELTNASRKKNP